MSGSSIQHWFDSATRSAAIATFAASIVLLWFAMESNKSTQDLITEVKALVSTNLQQVEALDATVKEIQHQTIVNAYVNGGNFDVKFNGCGKGEKHDADDNYLGQFLYPIPIMISNNGAQTIVPFYIFFDFEFYGSSNGQQDYDKYPYDTIRRDTFEYNPANPKSFGEVMLKQPLEKAVELGFTDIRIDVEYSFRAFSPYKPSADFGQSNEESVVLAKLTYAENDKWNVLDLRNKEPQIICK